VYGIKTAVGIPLNTALVGRIVVAMYSNEHVPENVSVAQACAAELAKYSPEPKWKLCIDTSSSQGFPDVHTPMQSGIQGSLENADSFTLSPINSSSQWDTFTPADDSVLAFRKGTVEQQIVALLGQHMPAANESSSSMESANQLQLFMSIRLLLLRSPERRTQQENEMIDILKNSFTAYAKDSRRGGKELARLIVKDWECLQSTYGFQAKPLAPPSLSSALPRPLPPASRRLSDPNMQRQLSVESAQRRTSSSSHTSSFLPLGTPPSAQSVKSTVSTGSLKPPVPFSLGSQQLSTPSLQMTHTRYLPQPSPTEQKQFSNNDTNIQGSTGTFSVSSNMKTFQHSPGFLPQSTPSSHQHSSVNSANLVLER